MINLLKKKTKQQQQQQKKKKKRGEINELYRGLNQAPRKLLKLNDGRDKAVVHLLKA